jgi:hypothetical protein
MVGALDPEVLAAEADVDRTLIVLALERSPLERVLFAQQMLETLMSFKRVEPSGCGCCGTVALPTSRHPSARQ